MYADWRGRFYRRKLPAQHWLAYYAGRFDTVELNATAYRLPKEAHVEHWCAAVPGNFRYTVKVSRLITHRKSLPSRVDDFIANYMARIESFRAEMVAQLLVQFPPYLERDDAHLCAFLDKLPPHHRYVVEFRHPSWHVAHVRDILRERNIALCMHDYPDMRMRYTVTATDLAYVRLHGYRTLYAGSYPRNVLRRWKERLGRLEAATGNVFVYFNNDGAVAAPHDAAVLQRMLARD